MRTLIEQSRAGRVGVAFVGDGATYKGSVRFFRDDDEMKKALGVDGA